MEAIFSNNPTIFRLDKRCLKYPEGAVSSNVVPDEMSRLDFNEDGFWTWFKSTPEYPINGFPDGERTPAALNACDQVKKFIKGWMRIVSMRPIRYFVPFLLFFPSVINEWLQMLTDYSYPVIKGYVLLPEYESRAVKEIRKAIMRLGDSRLIEQIADLICTIIEWDRPYRYRLQDLLSIVDLRKLSNNPRKEIKRAMKIFSERETVKEQRDWSKVGKLISYMMWWKSAREIVVKALSGIDQNNTDPDENDEFHCLLLSSNYNFRGMDGDRRMAYWRTLYDAKHKIHPQKGI